MSSDTLGKWLAIAVAVGGPITGLYVKLTSLEDAKNGHAEVLTEQRMEIRKLQERLLDVERNREVTNQMHEIDKRLARIEEMMRIEREGRERRRR